jgi:hypothetical protein
MTSRLRSRVRSFLIPDYDELALFAMSFTCILLIATGLPAEWDSLHLTFSVSDLGVFAIYLLFAAGLVLSFYHAFSNRRKTLVEKKLMLFFAVLINAFSGIWGGTYLLLREWGLLNIFPIWNIINGALLMGMLRGGVLSENNISDTNVTFPELLVGSVGVSLLYFFCHVIFRLNWAGTFSICVIYATNANGIIVSFILRKRSQIGHAS